MYILLRDGKQEAGMYRIIFLYLFLSIPASVIVFSRSYSLEPISGITKQQILSVVAFLYLIVFIGLIFFSGRMQELLDGYPIWYHRVEDSAPTLSDPITISSRLIIALLIGPIVEEAIFRKFLIRILLKQFSVVLAIIIQMILFGLWHITRGIDPSIFALGFLLGVIYLKTGNLFLPIAIHILWNLQVTTFLVLKYLVAVDILSFDYIYNLPELSILSVFFLGFAVKHFRQLIYVLENYSMKKTENIGEASK
jgi:membrane protease YdiL (CAAX protease family)